MRTRCWIVFGFLQLGGLHAQDLQEVMVTASRLYDGQENRDSLSSIPGSRMGDLLSRQLQNQTRLWIRTALPGAYAQLSFRGLPAAHTRIMWEGLPINSPALGVADLSAVSGHAFGHISFGEGSSLGMQGSNAAGGVLHLQNESADPTEWLTLHSAAGSFGFWSSNVSTAWRSGAWVHRLQWGRTQADNDFIYLNARGERHKRSDADFRQDMAKYSLSRKAGEGWLDASFWYQQQDQGVAGNVEQISQGQRQRDLFLRQFIRYREKDMQLQLAWFHEDGDYRNRSASLYDFNAAHTLMARLQKGMALSEKSRLDLSSDLLHVSVYGFEKAGKRNQWIGALRYRYAFLDEGDLQLRGRIDHATDGAILPALHASLLFPFSGMEMKMRFDQVNRRPGMNDLYWFNGGNPELKSENGNLFELEFRKEHTFSDAWKGHLRVGGFFYSIEDMIVWLPTETSFWSPENIRSSSGKGVEASFGTAVQGKSWKGSMELAYQYTQGVRDNGNGQVQTPGFPEHRLRMQGHLAYRRTHMRLSAQETSDWNQFSNGGTLGRLDGLSVYDLSLGQDIRFKRQRFSLSLSVLNLFDAAYAYQPHMPMPGRNYRLRLVYRISHKNNPK